MRLYCIPRNAEQCVEIQAGTGNATTVLQTLGRTWTPRFSEVREGSRQVRWDWVGPNFGKAGISSQPDFVALSVPGQVGCKYISICRSLVTPGEFYCAVA